MMKVLSFLFVSLFICNAALANTHGTLGPGPNHARLARRSAAASLVGKKNLTRRCPNRASRVKKDDSSSTQWTSTTTWSPQPTSNNWQNSGPASGSWGSATHLLSVQSDCGDIGATYDTTSQSGPNGNIYWLNCGIGDSGWRPPYVTVDQIVAKDLSQALQDSNSPFKACSSFTDKLYQYASENGLPAILLAAFAMQESSCDPTTVGGAGEEGLMQLTHEKCVNAPGGNCQDIDYNLSTGAKFIRSLLDSNGGDLLLTIGSYNGWYKGLTVAAATAAADTSCCRCQNNLDYLHQFLNGWLQNINAYTNNLGMYHNLAKCHY